MKCKNNNGTNSLNSMQTVRIILWFSTCGVHIIFVSNWTYVIFLDIEHAVLDNAHCLYIVPHPPSLRDICKVTFRWCPFSPLHSFVSVSPHCSSWVIFLPVLPVLFPPFLTFGVPKQMPSVLSSLVTNLSTDFSSKRSHFLPADKQSSDFLSSLLHVLMWRSRRETPSPSAVQMHPQEALFLSNHW